MSTLYTEGAEDIDPFVTRLGLQSAWQDNRVWPAFGYMPVPRRFSNQLLICEGSEAIH